MFFKQHLSIHSQTQPNCFEFFIILKNFGIGRFKMYIYSYKDFVSADIDLIFSGSWPHGTPMGAKESVCHVQQVRQERGVLVLFTVLFQCMMKSYHCRFA